MRALIVFLSFGIVLSILFSSGQIENPDTHLRLTQARIILDGHFGLPIDVGEDMHGNIAINQNGDRYMVYNPGHTIIFIPIYSLSKLIRLSEGDSYYLSAFFVSFINYFIHALCAFFLFRIALLLGAKESNAYLLAALFGLTSYSFVFAQSTYEHHFEMLFILMSFYYALKGGSRNYDFKSGLMLSIGLFFRTTTILAIPSILLMMKDNKSRIRALLGMLPGIVFILFYNYYRFGNPFESGYSFAWSLAHGGEFSYWSIMNVPTAILGLLFSPGKGLLIFSTTVLIAMLGAKSFWLKNSSLSYSILALSFLYFAVFAMNFAWHGSIWSFGPRYILPILPLLYLPAIYLKPSKSILSLILVFFILQVTIIAVNYKRDVLADFIENNDLKDNKYLFSINKTPYYFQAKQLLVIAPKNFTGLKDYQPDSPWKKEIRTASSRDVLDSSIEKNSINFWWVRVFHWKLSLWERIISAALFLSGLFGFIALSTHVKRKIL
jgi:hypothetical protein